MLVALLSSCRDFATTRVPRTTFTTVWTKTIDVSATTNTVVMAPHMTRGRMTNSSGWPAVIRRVPPLSAELSSSSSVIRYDPRRTDGSFAARRKTLGPFSFLIGAVAAVSTLSIPTTRRVAAWATPPVSPRDALFGTNVELRPSSSSTSRRVPPARHTHRRVAIPLYSSTTTTPEPDTASSSSFASSSSSSSSLPEVTTMRITELKAELESYGMSTKSFLEKKELQHAVVNARAAGTTATTRPSSTTTISDTSTTTSSTGPSTTSTSTTRAEQLQAALAECALLKVAELKQELAERGIATRTFFEKSEFVRALAEARVDNVSRASTSSSRGDRNSNNDEGYAEYANVEVLTSDAAGPRPKASSQSQQQQTSPTRGSGNPFGSGGGSSGMRGNPFGDMGGMGGIADMLKNMGVGGGSAAGVNPFGGMGGGMGGNNPFAGGADAMKKAQELMSNPNVRAIMAKAQSNPRVMAALQECMSNPAAFLKYQNDPEVSQLVNELRKYL